MKIDMEKSRSTVELSLGYQNASSSSKLSFDIWLPTDSKVYQLDYIKVGDKTIKSTVSLKANGWTTSTTDSFGTAGSGYVKIVLHKSGGSEGQKAYIDNVRITNKK